MLATPPGYAFLPKVDGYQIAFPHPNGGTRARTLFAKHVIDAVGPETRHQFFAIVVWRFHNTEDAWEKFGEALIQFAQDEDIGTLQQSIQLAYGDNARKSYLFSTGDGIRSSGGESSWRDAVLNNLSGWWRVSKKAAEILDDPSTTPDSWHIAFVTEIVPNLNCFGFDYWPKFLYGDVGIHVAPDKVEQMTRAAPHAVVFSPSPLDALRHLS